MLSKYINKTISWAGLTLTVLSSEAEQNNWGDLTDVSTLLTICLWPLNFLIRSQVDISQMHILLSVEQVTTSL